MSEKIYCDSCGLEMDDILTIHGRNYCPHCGEILNENLRSDESVQLPSPCIRVGDEDLKNWTSKEWFLKIGEELFEAVEAKTMQSRYPALYEGALAEELMDIITVCRSYLHALGYEGEVLRNLVEKVDKKNGDRGRL